MRKLVLAITLLLGGCLPEKDEEPQLIVVADEPRPGWEPVTFLMILEDGQQFTLPGRRWRR